MKRYTSRNCLGWRTTDSRLDRSLKIAVMRQKYIEWWNIDVILMDLPDWTPVWMRQPPAATTRPARSAWLPLTSSFFSESIGKKFG